MVLPTQTRLACARVLPGNTVLVCRDKRDTKREFMQASWIVESEMNVSAQMKVDVQSNCHEVMSCTPKPELTTD
jgi:hypothetical protein